MAWALCTIRYLEEEICKKEEGQEGNVGIHRVLNDRL